MPSKRCTGLLLLGLARAWAAEPVADASQMPRVPPTPPDRAAATFAVRPGFQARLLAHEPLVQSPVAMAIDESGAAFVVEMRDYSEHRDERLGRIRRLRDADGDGRFDEASVLAEGLPWPTAVACWDGGVFVGATPDIWYLKDTDGDGRADVREVVFTGFGSDTGSVEGVRLNVQALLNSFQWGVDQRLHGATSIASGKVRRVDSPFVRAWLSKAGLDPATVHPEVSLRGRDFAFDPRTLVLAATPGGGQHGMTFDAQGLKYLCSNSDHLQQVLYDDGGVTAEPGHALPATRTSIAADGPAATVFRRSPDEPWRVLRTRWRVSGLVEGMIEGGGRPSGYFTGATGVTVHRGDAYPADVAGHAFIADCGSNLIHRKRLRLGPDGLEWVGERVPDEKDREFLASTDNWFRPVQFVNAPDGCLWVLDMCRETIEHPWSLPDGIKRHLDLDSGRDRGRVWRLEPTGFDGAAAARRLGAFQQGRPSDWVRWMDHPNGWHRDTAARWVHAAADPSLAGPLKSVARSGKTVAGRLHALHELQAMGVLDADTARAALKDSHEAVRAAAVGLARSLGIDPGPGIAGDPSARVRMEVARQAATWPKAGRATVLASLLALGPDRVRQVALPATRGIELETWRALARDSSKNGTALVALARRMGARPDVTGLEAVIADVPRFPLASLRLGLLAALAEGRTASGRSLAAADPGRVLAPVEREALVLVTNRNASVLRGIHLPGGGIADANADEPPARRAALRWLAASGRDDAARLLVNRLSAPGEPNEVRDLAIELLGGLRGEDWARALASRIEPASPPIRMALARLLARRPEGRLALLEAFDMGWAKPSDLDADALRTMRSAGVPGHEADVRRWLGEAAPDRKAVVDRYLGTLSLKGQPKDGARHFNERCASCHRLGNAGHALGPDLASVASSGPEKLMVGILDPNREVAPSFTAWRAVLKDGEESTGLLVREDGGNVVLRQAGGTEATVPRASLRSLENTGRSLMPEGLEDRLSPQDLADLLAYLAQPQ